MSRAAILGVSVAAAAALLVFVPSSQASALNTAGYDQTPSGPFTDFSSPDLSSGEAAPDAGAWWNFDTYTSEVAPVDADKNTYAFLAMIRAAEGTAGPDGYNKVFGGGSFSSFADHPRIRVPFTQTDGKGNYSTAAGAYQMLASTWDDERARLGLSDFSPASQDAAAIDLILRRGALADVRAGRFDQAVSKVAATWASLPGSPYPQKTRSAQFVRAAFEQAGGVYA